MEEKVLFKFKGLNGQVTVYEDRLVITHKGLMGFLTQGLSGAKTLQMDSIKSVQYKKGGLVNGYIQFGLYGSDKSTGALDATSDENTVMFTYNANNEAEALRDLVQKKISELAKQKSSGSIPSGADEILKYKGLLDQGIISQEEFEAKKKQLLGL